MTRPVDASACNGPTEDADFVARLAEGLERLERGEEVDARQLCDGRPELVERVEAALARAGSLAGLNAEAAVVDPRIGERLADRYEIRGRLGAGGMGVVYAAHDTELHRTVAVKMMPAAFTPGEERVARFEREAEVLASIEHPAIVPIFDRGRTADGQAYIVMPRLRGRTAGELIEAPPDASRQRAASVGRRWLIDRLEAAGADPGPQRHDNDIRLVVGWIAVIARALQTVHEAGIVHRDIKPSNLFIRADGAPVLIDFGLVTLGPDTTVALRDAVIGTPAYMAPEQLDVRAVVRAATDVYGLTATLYHLLTFSRPYAGSPSQVLAALQRTDPVPAGALRPGLPRDLQAILDMGMAREPQRRYQSAAALADDLEAWLDYRPIRARPVSAARRVWRRWRRTATFRAVVGAAVIVALIAVAGAAAERRAAERSARHLAAFDRVAPVIVIGMPGLRVSADTTAEREMRASLDELVESAAEPSPARLIRAGFRFDRGEKDAAAADMRALAQYYGTPLLRAVADRYADPGTEEVDVRDLVPSEHPVDRLVLAFHLSRGTVADDEKVVELLRGRTDLLAGELEVHARIGCSLSIADPAERRAAFRGIHDTANRLEGIHGSASAFLERSKGAITSHLTLFREAKTHFERALALARGDYTIWHNLALAQNRVDKAGMRASLQRAIELQPASLTLHELMVDVELDAGEFDAASAWIDKAPFPDDEAGRRRRLVQRGHVLLARARHELNGAPVSDASRAASRRLASEAFTCFADARQPGADEWTFLMLLAKCLAEPEADYKETLFEIANRNPLDPDYLASICQAYEPVVAGRLERRLLRLVRRIQETLAPGKITQKTEDKK